MAIELITDWNGLAELAGPWNALAAGMPFRTWDWLATWWKHYGSGRHGADQRGTGGHYAVSDRQLYVLAVYDCQRTLIGVAPWYLDRTVVKGNVLRWLGSGEVCTDHLSLICTPENDARVAAAVADALTNTCNDWDRLDLAATDAGDAAIGTLVAELEDRDCLVSRHAADACWVLELPASWDDYLAALSKSHRKQLRQLERRVLEADRARWHRVLQADEFDRAWSLLVDLHQRRRQSLGEPGCFASRPFRDFHREIAGRMLERGQLRLSWLELDGEPIAAEYHVADRNTTYAYQGGVDPERLAEEPGRLSTILFLRAAIGECHQHVDFLRGDEPYKAHWRAVGRPTCDYRVVPNRRLARLRGRVLSMADILGDWVRQASEPLPANHI
jgi:CelD/BcsL family acetyltransferase involved in cellulose biosynthesis